MSELWLWPNLGAEEKRLPTAGAALPPGAAHVPQLWAALFGEQARLLPDQDRTRAWPSALGPEPSAPVFEWLAGENGLVPWLALPAAEVEAERRGLALHATDPQSVARVHDKAFAHRVAEREGWLPRELRGVVQVLEPEVLREPELALAEVRERLAMWPDWARRRFALKPRLGTSGRGRVPGRDGQVETPLLRGALPRLAERGGALLEPWLERRRDLSAQLHVPRGNDPIGLLGTLELLVSESGVYRGHAGEFDSRGRVFCEDPNDSTLREAAVAVALAARAEGYHGPCGVDAFSYRRADGDSQGNSEAEGLESFRPIVELNARFTLGTIAIGLVRRALRVLREPLGLEPGVRRAFLFLPAAAPDAWREAAACTPAPTTFLPLELGLKSVEGPQALAPGILFAPSREDLAPALAALRLA